MVAKLDSLYIRTRPYKAIVRLLSYAFFEGRPLATKGQWINPLVLALFHLQSRLPQLKKVYKPIFIIGSGRSGTTILGTLMSMHKDVGFLNEPKALWHTIYPEEDLVGTYSRGTARYRLDESNVSNRVRRTAHRIFGSYLAISGSRRVVDKYPELVFRIPFVQTIFEDAKFIFLVRNGWDTCQSIEFRSRHLSKQVQNSFERHDWWGADNRKWTLLWEQVISKNLDLDKAIPNRAEIEDPLNMAAIEWIVSMQEGLKMMRQYPNEVYLVRYEELVIQPEKVLNQLLAFCELPPDQRFLNYATQKLKPVGPKAPTNIHPSILPYFDRTMDMLGYANQPSPVAK